MQGRGHPVASLGHSDFYLWQRKHVTDKRIFSIPPSHKLTADDLVPIWCQDICNHHADSSWPMAVPSGQIHEQLSIMIVNDNSNVIMLKCTCLLFDDLRSMWTSGPGHYTTWQTITEFPPCVRTPLLPTLLIIAIMSVSIVCTRPAKRLSWVTFKYTAPG